MNPAENLWGIHTRQGYEDSMAYRSKIELISALKRGWGKLLLLFLLTVGAAINLQTSFISLQLKSLLRSFESISWILSSWILSWRLSSNLRSANLFEAINSNADLDPQLSLPSCLRYPFHMSELQKHVHLTILGYVFKVPLDDPIFGLHGPNASLTGRDGTHLVLGEKGESRYALDGVGTRALTDLLRWVQFLSPRYQCVGHLPGAYFDPMGDPTDYLQSIFMIWKQIIHDQFTLLVTFPRCHPYETGEGLTYVTCHDEIKPDGERVQRRPRLLFESSRRTPRCACASVGLLNSLTNLVNYPQCPPTSSKCLLSTQVN